MSSSPSANGGSWSRSNPISWLLGRLMDEFTTAKEYDQVMRAAAAVPPPSASSGVRVIGAGMSRTGTLSMYAALTQLGFKSWHGAELTRSKDHCARWQTVLQEDLASGGKKISKAALQAACAGYDAGVDMPFCDYWRELAELYPDAKIILTVRDKEKWWRSMDEAILQPFLYSPLHRLALYWFPGQRDVHKTVQMVVQKYERDGGLNPELVERRAQEVQAAIAPDRLLVYRVGEGWDRLCEFLEVPVPDQPFPRINDGGSMKTIWNTMTVLGMGMWCLTGAAAIFSLRLVYRHCLR